MHSPSHSTSVDQDWTNIWKLKQLLRLNLCLWFAKYGKLPCFELLYTRRGINDPIYKICESSSGIHTTCSKGLLLVFKEFGNSWYTRPVGGSFLKIKHGSVDNTILRDNLGKNNKFVELEITYPWNREPNLVLEEPGDLQSKHSCTTMRNHLGNILYLTNDLLLHVYKVNQIDANSPILNSFPRGLEWCTFASFASILMISWSILDQKNGLF